MLSEPLDLDHHNFSSQSSNDCDSSNVRQVILDLDDYTHLKWQCSYWKSRFKDSRKREDALKALLSKKEGEIRDLKRRLFGKKSEKQSNQSEKQNSGKSERGDHEKKPRGQERGKTGPSRSQHSDSMTEVVEEIALPSTCCSNCGLPYLDFSKSEESEIFEINVRAYKRKIKRARAKKGCSCPSTPGIITAPPPPKVIPKSIYGISIWEHILLGKFFYAQPMSRILQGFKGHGLEMSPGTAVGGLKKLSALFEPVYQSLYEKQMQETLFHNDESRWKVFAALKGKVGHQWYLWVTRSPCVIYYCIDPTRSAAVPLEHFSSLVHEQVFVVCDRYRAYKKLARLNLLIILAFCWAHVRRDFLELSNSYPQLKDWGLQWVERIGQLYHLNQLRLEVWKSDRSIDKQPEAFKEKHEALSLSLDQMKLDCDLILATAPHSNNLRGSSDGLHPKQKDVLTSLKNHWEGLCVFLSHPQVPMDNNLAEQSIRGPVVGRKNYYGSGSLWSAKLTAMMFSIFQTLQLSKINPHTWLRLFLERCAENGGTPPPDFNDFLPWSMSEVRKKQLGAPLKNTPPFNTS